MAAAWPAGTPCEFLYADGKWYRAISSGLVADLPLATSRGLVGEVLELAEVRARGVSTPVPLDEVASHVAAKGTHLVWTDADERKLELEKKKQPLSIKKQPLSKKQPHRQEEPISEKKAKLEKQAKQPLAPKQKQKQPAGEKKVASKPVASKPAAAPKQPAPRKNKKSKFRLVELGDDALHSVLRFAGPLGLGGAALACKRLLGLVKSLSAEAKGTFDRWALAAACAGLACNSLDRGLRDDELFIALCERTGCLLRCSKSQVLRELPTKAKSGPPGDDVVGSWGRAYHVNFGAGSGNLLSGKEHYLIPTVIGCIGGELLRGVIAVHTHPGSKAVGTAGSFRLLKCSDSFERLRALHSMNQARSTMEAETVSVIHPQYRLEAPLLRIARPASLCPLLLASMADPNLPSLAELQTLTQECYPRHNMLPAPQQYLFSPWNLDFARGPTLWPVESVLGLICRAADAQLAKFEQLPLDPKLVNCVQIKPRPLCWLSSKNLQHLQSHALWRSGDAAGLDQLWDELEAGLGLADELATTQSLLLQIVRLKARHFAGA